MSLRVTVGGNFATLAVLLNSRIPVIIRATSPIPNIALQNAMACRVFRHLKLGYIKRSPERFCSSVSNSITPDVTQSLDFMSPSGLIASNISGSTDGTYHAEHPVEPDGNQTPSLRDYRREHGDKSADSRV